MNRSIHTTFGRKVGYYSYRMFRRLLPVNSKTRVTILFVYADVERYGFVHKAIDKLALEFNPKTTHLIKINNWQPEAPLTQIGPNRYNVGGDNSAWEFSAWDKGLAAAALLNIESDVVVFVNDALLNTCHRQMDMHHYASMFNQVTLDGLSSAIAGSVHCSGDRQHHINGLNPTHWLRTNIFALTSDLLDKVKLASYDQQTISAFFPEQWTGRLFTEDAALHPSLKTFLTDWMTKGWPRAAEFPLNEANWPLIRGKLTAIINERLLSANLQEANARFYERSTCSRLTGIAKLRVVA